ncbi:MAG: Ig-like domain-containing protein [Chloroflexota bacterium]
MDKTRWLNLLIRMVVLFSLALGTAACGQAAEAGPRVWIDAPTDGALVPSGTPVTVISHAYAREGVAEVVLTIDGAAYRRDAPASPGATYVQINQDWLPPTDGTYALQVQAYGVGGQLSNLASITVRVGGTVTATSPITVTPVITATPTATSAPTETPTNTPTIPPPGASIQFWADPPQIQAGACTTIRWHVENAARVVFGGVDQPFDGSYKDCMCQSQRYQLTVVELDASHEIRTVDIAVNGSCVTPTIPPPPDDPDPPQPQQDTTPPPVPAPAVPANGLTLSCRASQTLAWLPVNDPSSPVKYYVKLEIKVTANEWQSAGGYGPITDKQVDVNVQCGGIYRWRVRAEDGAGNVSNWSAPSNFSINLD